MTYRWEPTTPLDRILEAGFRRIDEAVEGVIERLAPTLNAEYLDLTYEESQRLLNYRMSDFLEKLGEAAPKLWPTERSVSEMARRQGRCHNFDTYQITEDTQW